MQSTHHHWCTKSLSYHGPYSILIFDLFLAAMSSSRSDSVTHCVRPFVRVLFLISSFTSIVAKVLYSYLSLSCRLQFWRLHIACCLAAMSSLRSDSVTHFVRPFVRIFVRVLFFDFFVYQHSS